MLVLKLFLTHWSYRIPALEERKTKQKTPKKTLTNDLRIVYKYSRGRREIRVFLVSVKDEN